jgi:hypothetical protein
VWRGTCDTGCGAGTFALKANGEAFGFTDSARLISGTWSVNTDGSIALNLVSSDGGSASGTLPAGKTSCSSCLQLTDKSGTKSTLSLTQIAGGMSASSSAYAGLWYAGMTPTSQGVTAGLQAGGAVVVAAPDGSVYGLTDGAKGFSGTWTVANGQGTANLTSTVSSQPGTVTFDLSKLTGTLTVNGQAYGTLVFSRANGTAAAPSFVLHPGGASAPPISLVLNLTINWKNKGGSGSGGYSESLALDAHVDDSTGNRIASMVKPEQTYILFGTANIPPTTDNIALSYPQGTGMSYKVTFGSGLTTMTDPGGMTCSIANGSGTVNDAYQGDPSKYPTVTVTCN